MSILSSLEVKNYFTKYYPAPLVLNQINTTQSLYYRTIESILEDDEVCASLDFRKATSLSVPYVLEGAKKDVEFAKKMHKSLALNSLIEEALALAEFGFIPIEILWKKINNLNVPVSFVVHNSSNFRIDKNENIYYSKGFHNYQKVKNGKVIGFFKKKSITHPYGKSILSSVFPLWHAKWEHVAQMKRLGEKYSIPALVALTDATQEKQLETISDHLALLENGDSTALSGVKSVVSLTATGKVTELLDAMRYFDSKINKRITGQTLANSTATNGSRALGEVHERAALKIATSDINEVFKYLNLTLNKWVFEFNNKKGRVFIKIDEKKAKEKATKDTSQKQEQTNLSDTSYLNF